MDKPAYRLLIIDDSMEILSLLNEFFTKSNFEVVPVSNGLDGLKLIESEAERFDLIITDIVIPDISGIGIISIAKKKHPNTPIIGITGWGEHPQALAAEAKADAIIEKPFDLDELNTIITDLIAKRQKS